MLLFYVGINYLAHQCPSSSTHASTERLPKASPEVRRLGLSNTPCSIPLPLLDSLVPPLANCLYEFHPKKMCHHPALQHKQHARPSPPLDESRHRDLRRDQPTRPQKSFEHSLLLLARHERQSEIPIRGRVYCECL